MFERDRIERGDRKKPWATRLNRTCSKHFQFDFVLIPSAFASNYREKESSIKWPQPDSNLKLKIRKRKTVFFMTKCFDISVSDNVTIIMLSPKQNDGGGVKLGSPLLPVSFLVAPRPPTLSI